MRLTEPLFQQISELVYRLSGLSLRQGNPQLVRARLAKRLHTLGLGSFEEYLAYLRSDRSGTELSRMVEALTTHKTGFFREMQHFEFLRDQILPTLATSCNPVRFWSAGCSTGEEPYSVAMLLLEHLPNVAAQDVMILATDISECVLRTAKSGVYSRTSLEEVPPAYRHRYFVRLGTELADAYQVKSQVRGLVRFARLNLAAPWPMRGPFDVVLCRNVMIYFAPQAREALLEGFWRLLKTGGYLLVGHAESLAGTRNAFRYVRPGVYRK